MATKSKVVVFEILICFGNLMKNPKLFWTWILEAFSDRFQRPWNLQNPQNLTCLPINRLQTCQNDSTGQKETNQKSIRTAIEKMEKNCLNSSLKLRLDRSMRECCQKVFPRRPKDVQRAIRSEPRVSRERPKACQDRPRASQ